MVTIPTKTFTRQFDELPERIQMVIDSAKAGTFNIAMKTAYRPSFTIPSIWLVLTSDSFLLCNTHSTRGLWGKYARTELPNLRIGSTFVGRPCVEIEGILPETIILPVPKTLTREQLDEFVAEYRRLKGSLRNG